MANITWEQIANANTAIGTTSIKGKDYAEVNQRVKAFRMVYPTGLIETEMVSNNGGVCVIKATAGYYAEDGHFVKLATGTAFEVQSASYINKTSYVENCETSAVGRCLGFCGFGIDTSICSAEELNNALEQQNPQEPATAVNPKPVQAKPPITLLGVPLSEDKPEPVSEDKPEPAFLKDTPEESAYRALCLRKFTVQGLNDSCMRNFGTGFAYTPVALIKTKLPEDKIINLPDKENTNE